MYKQLKTYEVSMLAISKDPSQQELFKQLLHAILQHFSEYKSCVLLLGKMISNKTLAPYITISSIIDFIIVKVLLKVQNCIDSSYTNIENEVDEYTDLLVLIQSAVAPNAISTRI